MSCSAWPSYFVCNVNSTNRLLHLKNTLCTLCLRGWRFHAMPVFICNILQGSSITSRSKKVWRILRSHQLWGNYASHKKGTLFIEKAGSHYVILLYCETLLQVLLGIYCKRFYEIPLFTILLLFYVFEVGKAKSATQSVLMTFTLNGLFQKKN